MINDPMSQMAQAQKLSIPQLQQALRDGTINPQVGQIVLASKINQDKQAKNAMAAQAPKQPPVTQQDMAYGQGVPSLPTNLPPAGMAGGGIIAFDEGGYVPRYSGETDGSQVIDPYGEAISNAWVPKAYMDAATFAPRMLDKGTRYLSNSVGDAFTHMRDKDTMVIDPDTNMPISKYNLYRKLSNKVGKEAASQYSNNGKLSTPANPSFNLLGDNNASSVNPNQVTANFMADAKTPSAEVNPLAAGATHGNLSADQSQTEADIRAQYAGSNAPRGGPQGNAGIGGFQIKAPTFDDTYLQKITAGDINPATGQPWTPEEITAKRRAEEEKAGIKDIYSGQESELQALKEKYAKGSKLDEAMPWFAAAEALGRQPKTGEAPQSAIGSFVSGLGAYGKTASELSDKQEAKLDKIRTETNQLAQAKNAYAQAQLNGDRTEIKSAEDTLNSHYKALSDFGIKKTEAEALADAETKKIQAQLLMNQNNVGATIYAADKAERNVNQVAMQIQLDAAKAGTPISKSEAVKQAYSVINPGFGATAERDTASQRKALTDAINKLQTKYPIGMQMKPDDLAQYKKWTQQLAALNGGAGVADAGAAPTDQYAGFSKV